MHLLSSKLYTVPLELRPQRQLHRARPTYLIQRIQSPERAAASQTLGVHLDRCPEPRRVIETANRITKVGVIEEIEELSLELERRCFRQLKTASQTKVCLKQWKASQNISSQCSLSQCSGNAKRRAIEPAATSDVCVVEIEWHSLD